MSSFEPDYSREVPIATGIFVAFRLADAISSWRLQVSAAPLGLGLSAQTTAATMQFHQTIEKMTARKVLFIRRLALLQLISEVAEAFQEERITANHANLSHSYRRGL